MKFYSEVTKKFYDTEKACKEAEDKMLLSESLKNAERKEMAEKVNASYEAYKKAAKIYHDNLKAFCAKYGAYHRTISGNQIEDRLEDWIAMINML